MISYRLFLLERNRFVRAETLRAEDDARALEEAFRRAGTYQVEIWRGDRRLARIVPGSTLLHPVY